MRLYILWCTGLELTEDAHIAVQLGKNGEVLQQSFNVLP